MASSAALYTPAMLALAAGLAEFPLGDHLTLRGHARSPACGSTLEIGLELDPHGRIAAIGVRAHACAVGQAAVAIFAQAAAGQDRESLVATLAALEQWLAGDAPLPDWPGLDTVAAAREFPGRHGAMLLAWRAALDALPSRENAR